MFKNLKYKNLVLPVLSTVAVIGISVYASDTFAATDYTGAATREILEKLTKEMGKTFSLGSYAIGGVAGLVAAVTVLARQNLQVGLVSGAASVLAISLPSIFTAGAII